jgi:hypothetical protein
MDFFEAVMKIDHCRKINGSRFMICIKQGCNFVADFCGGCCFIIADKIGLGFVIANLKPFFSGIRCVAFLNTVKRFYYFFR